MKKVCHLVYLDVTKMSQPFILSPRGGLDSSLDSFKLSEPYELPEMYQFMGYSVPAFWTSSHIMPLSLIFSP